jgi:pimeloyl-ACP methyl ester carboxylesterase
VAATLALGVGHGRAADGCTPSAGDLHFLAADGTRLVGHRFGSGSTAVVLAHQSDGNLCQWVPYARRLAGLGYLVIAFDFRNVGESQTRHYPANQRFGGDVAAAANEARRLGASRVFLVGASLGGSAVLQAAANAKRAVAGVVSVSGAADLADAIASVKRLRVPVLYFAASGDTDFAADARKLYAATPPGRKSIEVVAGFEHGTQLVAANAKVRAALERFLHSG